MPGRTVQPDVDDARSRRSGCRAGSSRWQGLRSPKVTVEVARMAAPGTAPVSAADAGGQVDRDDRDGPPAAGRGQLGRPSSGSPGRPPMPRTPSITRSAAGRERRPASRVDQSSVSINRPPAASSAASPPACGLPRQRTRRHRARPGGPAGRRRTGRRRRCCPGRPGSAPGRRRPRPRCAASSPGDRCGQPGGGPLHQHVVVPDAAIAAASSAADLVDHERSHRHHASQITTADAMPASWDRLTWMVRDAQLGGPGGDGADDLERGPAAARR